MSRFIKRLRTRRAALAVFAVAALAAPSTAGARYIEGAPNGDSAAVTTAGPQDLRTPDAVTPIVVPETVPAFQDLRTPDAVDPMTPSSAPVVAAEPVNVPEVADGGFDLVSALLGAAVLGLLAGGLMAGVAFSRRAHGHTVA